MALQRAIFCRSSQWPSRTVCGRLCTLVAQEPLSQPQFKKLTREALRGQGHRANGDHLFQALPEIPASTGFETAATMLRSDKSRGYCLEMSCADYPPQIRITPVQVLAGRAEAPVPHQPACGDRVTIPLPKQPRIQLDPQAYQQLCRQVLQRDRWRCQGCGSLENLQVHHKRFRSQRGEDSEENLITLCARCHSAVHR